MFKSESIRMCVTKYTHENYDELVKSFDSFLNLSQFETQITNIKDKVGMIYLLKEPKCRSGQFLYGVSSDGSLVKLMYIIDSSD